MGLIDNKISKVDFHMVSWDVIFAYVRLEVGVEFLMAIICFLINILQYADMLVAFRILFKYT